MKYVLFLLFFSLNSKAIELLPTVSNQKSDHYHRCVYLSETHKIVHNFQIEQKYPYKCQYMIEVDNKLFKVYSARSMECEDFIRVQINKGSVCINNVF